MDEAPKVEELPICKECQGSGKTKWRYEASDGQEFEHEYSCPVCKGKGNTGNTGRMVTDPNALFTIKGALMNKDCLDMLLKAMKTLKTTTLRIRNVDPFKVTFSSGEILILKTAIKTSSPDEMALAPIVIK